VHFKSLPGRVTTEVAVVVSSLYIVDISRWVVVATDVSSWVIVRFQPGPLCVMKTVVGAASWVMIDTEVSAGPVIVTVDAGTNEVCSEPVIYTVEAG